MKRRKSTIYTILEIVNSRTKKIKTFSVEYTEADLVNLEIQTICDIFGDKEAVTDEGKPRIKKTTVRTFNRQEGKRIGKMSAKVFYFLDPSELYDLINLSLDEPVFYEILKANKTGKNSIKTQYVTAFIDWEKKTYYSKTLNSTYNKDVTKALKAFNLKEI